MSWLTAVEPDAYESVDRIVEPGVKDLGGFRVRRALPHAACRMVGPFVFLDHMGPALFNPGEGLDVRPHPHIGLSTLNYLTEGSILHRDSLGSVEEIVPGDVNLMTAGRGVTHSERSSPASRATTRTVTGLQCWLALPLAAEESEPAFLHAAMADLPTLDDGGLRLRLVLGSAYGAASPVVHRHGPALFAELVLEPGMRAPLTDDVVERAVYVVEGAVTIAGETFEAHRLLLFRPGDRITLQASATQRTRLILLGGEPLDGPRHLWWNFVSSSKDRIETAKRDWQAQRFAIVPGDTREFIPLP